MTTMHLLTKPKLPDPLELPTFLSNQDFVADPAKACRAAQRGPVVIIENDRPTYVLMRVDDELEMSTADAKLADLLAMPEADPIEFDPPRADGLWRPADLS